MNTSENLLRKKVEDLIREPYSWKDYCCISKVVQIVFRWKRAQMVLQIGKILPKQEKIIQRFNQVLQKGKKLNRKVENQRTRFFWESDNFWLKIPANFGIIQYGSTLNHNGRTTWFDILEKAKNNTKQYNIKKYYRIV